jgi:protein-disulfide isomerase
MALDNMPNQNTKLIIWIVVVIVVLATAGLIVLGIMQPPTTQTTPISSTLVPAITSSDNTEGNLNAKVSLIEYGDFQCPACGAYYPMVKQLVAAYSGKIAFAFRNYPLPQHADAPLASQAAEAAGLQGKYWQMHDALYENQSVWSAAPTSTVVSQFFDNYASSLGINVAQLNTDMNSAKVLNKIQSDISSGNAVPLQYTPTFFINLKQISNPTSYDQFKSDIDQALSATGS